MRRSIILVIFIIFNSSLLLSQESKVISDLEFWAGSSYSKNFINKKLDTKIEAELRLRKNITEFQQFNTELSVNYQLIKYLEIGGGLRYTFHKTVRKHNSESLYRFHLNMELSKKINRFKLNYRIKYQNVDDDLYFDDSINKSVNVFRNKVLLKYNLPKSRITPYFSSELFTNLNSGLAKNTKVRLALGVNLPIMKRNDIKLFYMIEQELNSNYPFRNYIVGFSHAFR